MSYWRMPWNRNIGPIGLDLGAEHPRAMQVRLGEDAPRETVEVRIDPDAPAPPAALPLLLPLILHSPPPAPPPPLAALHCPALHCTALTRLVHTI